MTANHGNLKKDMAPNIKVFTTDISLEKFRLTRIPAFEFHAFLNKLRKSMDWFLYDNGLRHERVN